MKEPFSIELSMPDGDASALKIINKTNWAGLGMEISRAAWPKHRNRNELKQIGIYILIGYQDSDNLPSLYIGQGDGLKKRIESHYKNKPFWDRALIFVCSNQSLNRAHTAWLKWALVLQAQRVGRCKLDNIATPNKPRLTPPEQADTYEFLNEIRSILPSVEVSAFEAPKKIEQLEISSSVVDAENTIVVPAQGGGFKKVFLDEDCWYAIRIASGKLKQIKYIAVYQVAPISAITHIAEVASIEPYGDGRKYKLNFVAPAKTIEPLKLGSAPRSVIQGPIYTNYLALTKAKDMGDLFS